MTGGVAGGLWVLAHESSPAGPGGLAPTVMLVHGSMDRAASFAKVARRLGDLDVRRYDRRGYGRSRAAGRGRPATIADHADDLLAVLAVLAPGGGRLHGPVAVVGHSIGGVVALAAAQARPDLVDAVGAYEAPMPWVGWWPPSSAGNAAVGAAAPALEPGEAAERFLRRMLGDERWERLPRRTRDQRRAEGPALVAELRDVRARAPYDPAAIAVPVLAAHGTDSAPHHVAAARALAEAAGSTPTVIDGAGHGAHSSHPDAFAAWVRAVVEQARTRRRGRSAGVAG